MLSALPLPRDTMETLITQPTSAPTRRPPRGLNTWLVMEAIHRGHRTLAQISEHTGLSYRDVNAYVDHLQRTTRVGVLDESQLPDGDLAPSLEGAKGAPLLDTPAAKSVPRRLQLFVLLIPLPARPSDDVPWPRTERAVMRRNKDTEEPCHGALNEELFSFPAWLLPGVKARREALAKA